MQRAGQAVAVAARDLIKPDDRVLVLCGPGNNGGDGFVAARLLAESGLNVAVALLGSRAALRGDALLAAADWPASIGRAEEVRLESATLLVDALFGVGLSRELKGEARALVERLNATAKPVLAVDLPSGLDGDTGEVRGAAVQARRTVTFARRKPGHLLYPGRALCGEVTVADIGISDD